RSPDGAAALRRHAPGDGPVQHWPLRARGHAASAADLVRLGGSLVAARHARAPGRAGAAAYSSHCLISTPLATEDVLRAAHALQPVLRERQAECEALGRLPDATNQAFIDAGLYRILQPRRFGGLELDMPSFFRIMAAIARGCPSSGWVLAL